MRIDSLIRISLIKMDQLPWHFLMRQFLFWFAWSSRCYQISISTSWLSISCTFILNVTKWECLNDEIPPIDFKNTQFLPFWALETKIKHQKLFKSAKIYRMQKHKITPTASWQVKSDIVNNQGDHPVPRWKVPYYVV